MPVSILFLSSCIFYSVLIGSLLYILTFQVSHQLKLRDGILKVQCSSCSVFSTSQQSFQEMLTSVKKISIILFVFSISSVKTNGLILMLLCSNSFLDNSALSSMD